MTFSSDAVRLAFHQLPTETQVQYVEFETRLAAKGQRLQVEGVQQYDCALEVVVRISEKFDSTTA